MYHQIVSEYTPPFPLPPYEMTALQISKDMLCEGTVPLTALKVQLFGSRIFWNYSIIKRGNNFN